MNKTAPSGVAVDAVAKRGDLVVVHLQTSDFIIGRGPQSHDEFQVGVITSITRDGRVKAYCPVGSGGPMVLENLGRSFQRVYVMSKTQIDVQAAMETAGRHTWPGHDYPRYYDTLDEVKADLRAHLLQNTK